MALIKPKKIITPKTQEHGFSIMGDPDKEYNLDEMRRDNPDAPLAIHVHDGGDISLLENDLNMDISDYKETSISNSTILDSLFGKRTTSSKNNTNISKTRVLVEFNEISLDETGRNIQINNYNYTLDRYPEVYDDKYVGVKQYWIDNVYVNHIISDNTESIKKYLLGEDFIKTDDIFISEEIEYTRYYREESFNTTFRGKEELCSKLYNIYIKKEE